MEGVDYWRACKQLTIVQAVLLTLGLDPAIEGHYVERNAPENQPPGYVALKSALIEGIKTLLMLGDITPLRKFDDRVQAEVNIPDTVDCEKSIVFVDEYKFWLRERGIPSDFFSSMMEDEPDFLQPKNPRYAHRLAAAVKAWQAVGDEPLAGHTPKQLLQTWLREHAAEFDLCLDNGKPNETGIEEVAKVANWRPLGGAPKTPV
jgi:hypothetical protein